MIDTLVLTPSLGSRSSIVDTILSVKLYGQHRVDHILVGPSSQLNSYKTSFPWVKILNCSDKSGVYKALNYGLRLYGDSYKYFAYINDDDSWSPGFTKLFSFLDSNPDVDLVYGRVVFGNFRHPLKIGAFFPFPRLFRPLLRHGVPLFTQQAVIVRIDALSFVNFFDESLPVSADSDCFLRLVESGFKVKGISSVCAYYDTLGFDRLSHNTSLLEIDRLAVAGHSTPPRSAARHVIANCKDYVALVIYRLYNLPVYLVRLLGKAHILLCLH